jgi:membrane fusion protein (multidrug efflux system)
MAPSVETRQQPDTGPAPENRQGQQANGVGPFLRNRPRARLALLILAIIAVVAGVAAWRYYAVRETTDDAQIDGHITPIAARVGGTVLAVDVDDNQFVQAGMVLVQIDPKDYQVALARAQAELADARAALAAAETAVPITTTTTSSQVEMAGASVERAQAGSAAAARGVEVARAKLNAAEARLREANANNVKAQKDLERMKQLVAKDEVSEQQYDAAVAWATSAGSAVQSAQASVAEATQSVSVAESQRVQAMSQQAQAHADLRSARTAPEQVAVMRARARSAEARVEQSTAALETAQLNLQYTTIKAPTDGVVSKKSVEPGQIVQPGQPLLALVPLSDIWVTANFKETQLHNMRPGQPALIKVDAYGRTYRGHVDSIAAATGARFSLLPPENATGNYVKVVQRVPVKIVFEKEQDPEHLLRPGMSVVPTVMTK